MLKGQGLTWRVILSGLGLRVRGGGGGREPQTHPETLTRTADHLERRKSDPSSSHCRPGHADLEIGGVPLFIPHVAWNPPKGTTKKGTLFSEIPHFRRLQGFRGAR